MANKTKRITIDSILGGHSGYSNLSSRDQFRASIGIDPSQPVNDSSSGTYNQKASGIIRPNAVKIVDSLNVSEAPNWIVSNPKLGFLYMLDHRGSAYTIADSSPYTVTALSDGGSLSNGSGNGAAYYDNYIYFSKDTTVARYGPLDGTPAFDGNYWNTTLGKAALNNSTLYPTHSRIGNYYPQHVLHRHSDGKLYIADVVGGKGSLSYISTIKTTVEGDTDNGSTFNKISFGQNFWPSAIESYGTDLVVALFEGGTASSIESKTRAKIVRWDTVSQNFNSISNDEFPDQFISAMKNINGTLYIVSGDYNSEGFRLSRYIGGNSIEEVAFFPTGSPCFAGAISVMGNVPIFGSHTESPRAAAVVYSYGLPNVKKDGLFCIASAYGTSGYTVTALSGELAKNMRLGIFVVGTSNGTAGTSSNNIAVNTRNSPDYGLHFQYWWSQMYNIGGPFKITKIKIPLAQAIAANMIVTPTVYTDDGTGTTYSGGTAAGLPSITNTNYSGKRYIVLKPENMTGTNNFWLELAFTGSVLCAVSLPIVIEYEEIEPES